MKKLMMAGLLFMAGAALADAQFYEMQLTVKTTVTKSGKVKMVACDCRTDTNTLYRKQGSVKIKGVIWGCDCGTLIKGVEYTSPTNPFGYFFWNETTKTPLNVKLKWLTCNRIDASAKKVEAVWQLSMEDGTFLLTGSGFGAVKDTVDYSQKPCKLVTSYFTQLSGNFAGWMMPGAIVTAKATAGTCTWCSKIPGTAEVTASANGWGICSIAGSCTDSDYKDSAAYGTWKIKYNAKASKLLERSTKVTDAYAFPAYVKAVMED